MSQATLQTREKTAQLLWTAFILMFFVIQAVIWTVAISIISMDSSHVVVANYDEQALNWDEVKKQREASAALGWTANISILSAEDLYGNRVVQIKINDASQQPVTKALVQMRAFHRGRAAEVPKGFLDRN